MLFFLQNFNIRYHKVCTFSLLSVQNALHFFDMTLPNYAMMLKLLKLYTFICIYHFYFKFERLNLSKFVSIIIFTMKIPLTI